MDILLEDCLKSDDWEATCPTPHQVAKVKDFKGKFLNFIRKLNGQNFNYDLNKRRPWIQMERCNHSEECSKRSKQRKIEAKNLDS